MEISKKGIRSKMIIQRPQGQQPAFCFFEYVYFARPDSVFEGESAASGVFTITDAGTYKSGHLG